MAVNNVQDLLPTKSKSRYEKSYYIYKEWCADNGIEDISSENVLLAYFSDLSKNKKASTLWATYSMLRATLNIKENVDISKFASLNALLKKQNVGYKPKKSSIFTRKDIERFLRCGPLDYIPHKAALIIGVSGACRSDELFKMKITDINFLDDKVRIQFPDAKPFLITYTPWIAILRQYVELRKDIESERFFLQIRRGKATKQPYGHNSIAQFPKKIATFLNLKDIDTYTGHCFRRSAVTLLVNSKDDLRELKKLRGRITSTIASYVDNSLDDREKGHSTSTQNYIDTNSVNDDDSQYESVNQNDSDDCDGELVDVKVDMFDTTEANISWNETKPLTVAINTSHEYNSFGEFIAKHLQQLPSDIASELKSRIHNLVTHFHLEHIQHHPSEAPPMVKVELSPEEPVRTHDIETQTNQPSESPVEIREEETRHNTDPPEAKRFKPDNSDSHSAPPHEQQSQHKRIECIIFAEQIALQLEQLPQDVSLQLKSEIYELIMRALPKTDDEVASNRVKLKDDGTNPSEIINYQSY